MGATDPAGEAGTPVLPAAATPPQVDLVNPDKPEEVVPAVNVTNNFEVPDTPEEFGELLEAAPIVVKETKSAYKTTEFWLTIIGILAVTFNGVPMPESKEGYVAAALAGVYAISRGLAKKGVADVEEGT